MATAIKNNALRADRRRRAIQSSWSAAEREQRAERARRRTARLAALLLPRDAWNTDTAIWAVGAPAIDDLRRIAG